MDIQLPKNIHYFLTPLFLTVTYYSAFESGKPTCNRFIINYFLYLISSQIVYFTAIKFYDDKKIQIENKYLIGLSILLFVCLFGLLYSQNTFYKHLFYLLILLILAYLQNIYLKKIKKEVIEEILQKMMIIIIICIMITLKYPQYINQSLFNFLIFGLIFVIFFRLIDIFFLKKKNNEIISMISVFLFAGFIMYDSKRVIEMSKECRIKGGNPDYLDHVLDMVLNLQNLFNNLSNVIE